MNSLSDFRREYTQGGLSRLDLNADPLEQFQRWLEQAIESGIGDPTAMSIATVDASGRPWQRIVLLKEVDQRGFVFCTNFTSRKAEEIASCPEVCLLFPWKQIDRQVIVAGTATKCSREESAAFFRARPRDSQLAAWASRQSAAIADRDVLEDRFTKLHARFADSEVPAPDFWGGYRITPHTYEYWQGRPGRLHDRFRYEKTNDSWSIERLNP